MRTWQVEGSRRTAGVPRLSRLDRVLIVLMFLLPMPASLGAGGARTGDALRFGAIGARLILDSRTARRGHVVNASMILLSMFFFAVASVACGVSHTLRDAMDVLRIAAFYMVFCFGASMARRGRGHGPAVVAFAHVLVAVGIANALFSIGQYTLPDLTRPLQQLYCIAERHLDVLKLHARAVGFFGNPNTNAVMLLLLSLPSLVLFHFTRRQRYLIAGGFVFLSVVLAGSKTGLILAGVLVASVCLASGKLAHAAGGAALAAAGYWTLDFLIEHGYVELLFPYVKGLLYKVHDLIAGGRFELTSFKSYNDRLEIWEDTMAWFYDRPILGSGPLRSVLPSWADNYYVYLLSRYGAIGLAHYAAFSIYLLVLSLRAARSRQAMLKGWGLACFGTLVTVNVANHTIDAFLVVPIASFTLLLSGYLAGMMDLPRQVNRSSHLIEGRALKGGVRSNSRAPLRAPAGVGSDRFM